MKYEMVESFFDNLGDYMRFLLRLQELKRASSDYSCVATLKQEGDRYFYTLEWKDGRWVGEYVRPFRANEENLRLFNAGCAEVARRMRIFIETGDPKKVPLTPPAFGILSCESPDELAPPPKINRPVKNRKYFPAVYEATPVRRYDAGMYTVVLMTNVKCHGIIQCTHLLVAFRKGENEPSYVVAAEVNNLRLSGEGLGSHYLGCYPGSGHFNLGCSDDWGDLSLFEKKACKVMSRELNIQIP